MPNSNCVDDLALAVIASARTPRADARNVPVRLRWRSACRVGWIIRVGPIARRSPMIRRLSLLLVLAALPLLAHAQTCPGSESFDKARACTPSVRH